MLQKLEKMDFHLQEHITNGCLFFANKVDPKITLKSGVLIASI